MALTPGTRIGRYEVIRRLGAGGMGEVYLASDSQLVRSVALKILHESNRDSLKRFEREARAASALSHPNILVVHEFGLDGDLHFIATEFVEGVTLRQRLRAGPIALPDVLDLAVQSATALAAAHEGGLVHRDVKPENLMIRPDGFVKVLDFGLARFDRATASTDDTSSVLATTPGMVMGTVSYMSPEQVRGESLDGRTDIWSLGLVVYEMLAGRSPFKLPTQVETLAAILQRDPPPLESVAGVPDELGRIVAKTLTKERELRYQSARELAIDLRRFKQRLEIDSHLARSGATPSRRGPGSETSEMLPSHAPPAPATPATGRGNGPSEGERSDGSSPPAPPRRWRVGVWTAGAIVAMVLGIAAALMSSRGASPSAPRPTTTTASTPQSTLTYFLTVQKMREGREYQDPFVATGREIFENGWKFRLDASNPQPGYIYLLNEGPTAEGRRSFNLLYPTPGQRNGSAELGASEHMQTGWFQFDEHQGTERFWMIWSRAPITALEQVTHVANPIDRGAITRPQELAGVVSLLEQHPTAPGDVVERADGKVMVVRGDGDIVVNRLELEHR